MNCHACGASLAATARFCHKCGAQVGDAQSAGWRAGLPWSVAGAALGALLTVVALRLGAGSREQGAGDAAGALAQADTVRRAVPTHLFGFMLRARALDLKRDAAGARRAYADFLKNEAAERTRQRPEYGEHAENLDA